jgi:methanogenic corrinoid protein MtbC1
LKKNGYQCHYFGQKTPVAELKIAKETIQPQLIVTTFVAKISEKRFLKIHKVLEELSKDAQVVISGGQLILGEYEISDSILHVKELDQIKTLVK